MTKRSSVKNSKKKAVVCSAAERKIAYQLVSNLRPFWSRAEEGTRSTICEDPENPAWVIKSDLRGGDRFVGHELDVYNRLNGCCVCPRADMEFGVFGFPESIRIEKINNGGNLLEYAECYELGLISEAVWLSICLATKSTLEKFFELGWVHGDLHAKNIVVGLTDRGDWSALLIDFGVSFNKSTRRSDLADLAKIGVFFEKEPDQQDDMDYLLADLAHIGATEDLEIDLDALGNIAEEPDHEYEIYDVIRL